MNTIQHCKTAVAIALMCVASGSFAATMSKPEYSDAKKRITADYKVDKAACGKSSANAKDICMEQAKGKEKIARAELEYGYTGKAKDGNKVGVAKADATYAVAKEMCDDKSGQAKTLCRTEAKSAHKKSLADSTMMKKVGEAKMDASDEKREANYKVAVEKCDSMSGDAKTSCVNTAKTTFKKS